MVLLLLTKLTGMIFIVFMASEFGTTTPTDIFYLASVIPETITNIILLGAISGSVIPIFIKVKEKNGDAAFRHSFSATLNAAMLVFTILSILAWVFARQLIPVAVSLADSKTLLTPDDVDQVIMMMRVLLIPQLILVFSAFLSTGLNIYNRFVIPQMAPLFFNIGKIVGVLVFVPMLDSSIWGIVWGILLGSILHLLVQIPLLRHLGVSIKFLVFDFRDQGLKEVIRLGLPRVFSLGAERVALIVDSLIALGVAVRGSLTAYNYAINLVSIPLNLFGTSYAVASFPTFSRLYAEGAKEEFELLLNKIINQVLFLAIPVTAIMLILRVPIVRLVFGILGNNFTWESTLQVAWIVMFFSLGLSLETLRTVMFRVFFAIHNSWIPFLSSLMVVALGIVTGLAFTNYFSHFDNYSFRGFTLDASYFLTRGDGGAGIGGLGLSSSLVFSLEFIFLLIMMKWKGIIRSTKPIFVEMFKKVMAGVVVAIVGYAVTKLWEEILPTDRTIPLAILTFSTMITSFTLYLWTAFIFKVPEVEIFVSFLVNLIRKWRKTDDTLPRS